MKELKSFTLNDSLPSDAQFVCMNGDGSFIYEVRVRENETKKRTVDPKDIDHIIDYLNKAVDGSFGIRTEATRKLIKKWLLNGKTVDNFEKVIKKKRDEWIGDPEWSKYLRPSTLFGPKFEGYLSHKTQTDANEELQNEMDDLFESKNGS